ncbi:MAG: ATPase [Bacteroidetes bacterium HGW-Bacteroidetes-2]|nr:MAG: ATPase [Bacteroidetes bacterium HGW-Bacteroidetes-2]
MKPKRIVLTGGPGTGKSSIITKLESYGYPCLEEISRKITLQAKAEGINQLFLEKPLLFSQLLLDGRILQYNEGQKHENNFVFYDRGMHDVVAYLDYFQTEYPKGFQNACKQHPYDLVFILPPWEEIYIQDNERYENFEEAKKIHNYLERTYKNYAYIPIEVPRLTLEARVEFILEKISHKV